MLGKRTAFRVTYDITLTGTLLPDEGSPYALDSTSTQGGAFDAPYPFRDAGSFGGDNPAPTHVGPYSAFDSNRSHTGIEASSATIGSYGRLCYSHIEQAESIKGFICTRWTTGRNNRH